MDSGCAYLARFEDTGEEDRIWRCSFEEPGYPPSPPRKVWGPSTQGMIAFSQLSGDEPFTTTSGRVVTPPEGGFYKLWREQF